MVNEKRIIISKEFRIRQDMRHGGEIDFYYVKGGILFSFCKKYFRRWFPFGKEIGPEKRKCRITIELL